MLLESSDYHGSENSFSYLCFEPLASFEVHNGVMNCSYPDGSNTQHKATRASVLPQLIAFANGFETDAPEFKFITNGLFGYMGYDAVQYCEDVDFDAQKPKEEGGAADL